MMLSLNFILNDERLFLDLFKLTLIPTFLPPTFSLT